MNSWTKNLFRLPALIAGLGLILAGRVAAQTFTTLHSFTEASVSYPYTNSDGALPAAGLIVLGNTLYGTTVGGGSSANGTVFAVNIDGTGFTNLHSFTDGADGAQPHAGLILSGNTLYGTSTAGFFDSSGGGTVFAINPDGTGFTNVHSFAATSDYPYYTNSNGANPNAGLILWSNTLYGTAYEGGSSANGTVFKVNTDGTGFTNLHNFTASSTNSSRVYTNSDGAYPFGELVLSGNTLYGTASQGGSSGKGTVFKVNADGTGFTNLHSFTALNNHTNSDGIIPLGGLVLSGNTLYGTAYEGGSSANGTVFAVNIDGTGFTNLHNFTGGADGAQPHAGLILSGNTVYGTAYAGGSSGNGTVFKVNTDGSGFTTLYSFTANPAPYTNSDGANPAAPLILSGNTLYGTAYVGGSSGNGTVFSLSFKPQLTIIPFGANVILTWPANVAEFDYTGYTLQSTTNLAAQTVWSTNSPAPVVVNGQNTVTNPISGTQQFFRLSQ